jgi:hypothetical protein
MARAETWAKERGLDELRLNQWVFNREAKVFYESLGYRVATQNFLKRV